MQRRWEFSEAPDPVSIRYHGEDAEITFAEDIREEMGPEDTKVWTAEVYFLTVRKTPDLVRRIQANHEAYLAKAKTEARNAENSKAQLGQADLMEIVLDQEVRLAMLEMGVAL